MKPVAKFEIILRTCLGGAPPPRREYQFCSRKWLFDYAWPDCRLAVEVDGGTRLVNGGRHNTDADREKCNVAAALGWRVIHLSGELLKDSAYCAALILAASKGTEPPLQCPIVQAQRRRAANVRRAKVLLDLRKKPVSVQSCE